MKNLCISFAFLISTLAATAMAQENAAVKKPYNLVVWADVSFDDKSQLAQILIPEKDNLPQPFVSYLMGSIATTPFNKPENAEANKQLETGLKVVVEIDPATSKAKILAQDLMPRPVRVDQQPEPVIRVKGEWTGRFMVTCTISEKGRCIKVKPDPAANVPADIAKVLSATIGSWRFAPQKRAGKAIEGEFSTWVTIESDTSHPPTTFDNRI